MRKQIEALVSCEASARRPCIANSQTLVAAYIIVTICVNLHTMFAKLGAMAIKPPISEP